MRGEKLLKEYFAKTTVQILATIEIFLFFMLSFWLFNFFKLLLHKEVCHPNLRLLLIAQPFTHWVALGLHAIRMVSDLAGLSTQFVVDASNFVIDMFLGYSSCLMLAYAVERFYAMHQKELYERNGSTNFAWLVIAIILTACTIIPIAWYLDLVTMAILEIFYYGFYGTATFFFVVLWLICKFKYQIAVREKLGILELRFLTGRNLQASKLLLVIGPFKSLSNTMSLILYEIIYFNVSAEYFPLCIEIFIIYNYLQLSSLILIVIYHYKHLRKNVSLFCKASVATELSKAKIRSITGEDMNYSVKQQEQIYFAALARDLGDVPEARPARPRSWTKYIKT